MTYAYEDNIYSKTTKTSFATDGIVRVGVSSCGMAKNEIENRKIFIVAYLKAEDLHIVETVF